MFFRKINKKLILDAILITVLGCNSSNSSIATSTATPIVELKSYKLDEEKAFINIEIWNPLDREINSLFLQLQCESTMQKGLDFYILLYSKNSGFFEQQIKKTYTIKSYYKMNSSISFQETRDVNFEINTGKQSEIESCTNIHVIGYN